MTVTLLSFLGEACFAAKAMPLASDTREQSSTSPALMSAFSAVVTDALPTWGDYENPILNQLFDRLDLLDESWSKSDASSVSWQHNRR